MIRVDPSQFHQGTQVADLESIRRQCFARVPYRNRVYQIPSAYPQDGILLFHGFQRTTNVDVFENAIAQLQKSCGQSRGPCSSCMVEKVLYAENRYSDHGGKLDIFETLLKMTRTPPQLLSL